LKGIRQGECPLHFEMVDLVSLVCPVCRGKLSQSKVNLECERCNEIYEIKDDIPVLLPSTLDKFSLEEANYHSDFDDDPIEVHQLNTIRNEYYHDLLRTDVISSHPELVLEVGGGTGQDATAISNVGVNLVETDISLGALIRGRQLIEGNSNNKNVQFVCCTLSSLPFPDQSFDTCFGIAMIHHLKNIIEGMLEMSRVTKEGGRVILGIEPNATYFRQIKRFRKILCSLSHTDQGKVSKADAEMSGFTERELRDVFIKAGFAISKVIPVWLTLGYFHYGQEFLFRALRLKKRVRLPKLIEKFLLMFDRALFALPLTKYFCWHWIITGVKR
jgi:ubiquinone/menaquinone biosynthesis C-methylase UbiE/uncharacterized protein YbaR (Trm112 family)